LLTDALIVVVGGCEETPPPATLAARSTFYVTFDLHHNPHLFFFLGCQFIDHPTDIPTKKEVPGRHFEAPPPQESNGVWLQGRSRSICASYPLELLRRCAIATHARADLLFLSKDITLDHTVP
jgi:hypothetical protein